MGVYLSSPNTEKDTIQDSHQHLNFVASSMQGWRTNMEDAHIMDAKTIGEDTSVFGVFDGHGGKEVAKYVQNHFIEELKANKNFQEKNFKDALYETFLKMDILLQTEEGKKELNSIKSGDAKSDGFQGESYAGCTANVSLIHKNTIYCANAGDSRSVLCRGGNMFELSQDHKPDQEKERDRVKKAGGFISDGRINGNLNLSRAMGDLEYKRNTDLGVDEQLIIACPDIHIEEIKSEDEFILMGCDGIWETKSNQELITFVRDRIKQKEPIKKIIEDLLDSIVAPDTSNGYGCDNMTAIIITMKDI